MILLIFYTFAPEKNEAALLRREKLMEYVNCHDILYLSNIIFL